MNIYIEYILNFCFKLAYNCLILLKKISQLIIFDFILI